MFPISLVVLLIVEALFFVMIGGFVTRKAMLLTGKAMFPVRFGALHISNATTFISKYCCLSSALHCGLAKHCNWLVKRCSSLGPSHNGKWKRCFLLTKSRN